MKTHYNYILLFVSLAGIASSGMGLLNNAVSKKYELNDPADCISKTSGANLCLWENILLGSVIVFSALLLYCIYALALKKKTTATIS